MVGTNANATRNVESPVDVGRYVIVKAFYLGCFQVPIV